MRNATIASVGACFPEQVITNQYFDEQFGEDVDSWLRENVQIHERRWCRETESVADLCEGAARVALQRANITAEELDLIIIATDTPEFLSPSTASIVQHRLNATNAGSFDLNTACAGFVTALDVAAKYIRSDEQYNKILVIGGYAMSKHLNKNDKKTATLFADGAGAVVLKAVENGGSGFLTSKLLTDGQYNEWMGIYGGGTRQPIDAAALENHDHQLKFVKRFPKEINPQIWTKLATLMASRIGVSLDEVSHFFITQINVHSIFETMDLLGQPRRKAHTVMHYYGYTGSACIPMALNDAWEKELIKKGDLVFFIGSGGGLAFASAAFRI